MSKVRQALLLTEGAGVLSYPVIQEADGTWPSRLEFEEDDFPELESYAPTFDLVHTPYFRKSPVYQQVAYDGWGSGYERVHLIPRIEQILKDDPELLGAWRQFMTIQMLSELEESEVIASDPEGGGEEPGAAVPVV